MIILNKGLISAGVLLVSVSISSLAWADIIIGVAGPMTGSTATIGKQMKLGAEMAVKDINAAGGVNGQQLKLDIGDDACDAKQAVAVANDLVNKGAVFVVGHDCSSASIAASTVYAENDVVMITPSSTSPKLTDDAFAKGDTSVFRVCGRDDQQGIYAGNYIFKHFKTAKIAIIDDKSAYGKGVADQAEKALVKDGIKPVMREEINAGDKDFSALISKMKAAGITLIYFGGYYTEAGLISRESAEVDFKPQMIAGDGLASVDYWKIAGNAGEGTMFTFSPDPRKNPAAKKVLAEFKAEGSDPESYTLYTYAAVQVWADAANAVKSIDEKKVSDNIHTHNFKTVVGLRSFDKKGDITAPDYTMYKFSKGAYAEIK